MSLGEAIAAATRREELSEEVLGAAFGEIMEGRASPVQIAALLVALRTKGETVGEIVAAARALRARAVTAPLPHPGCVDTCGTGGDGSDSFNVSTVSALVAAGAGVPVAKHGNRSASSRCGSADLLEALGVEIDLPIETCAEIVAEVGIGFFFARRAHPAMREVAPVRAALGIRTVMNCLGPLLSPVGARFQLVGVYEPGLVPTLARALGALGAERALVVHGGDGLDEITTSTITRTALWDSGELSEGEIDPRALGIPLSGPEALRGGDPAENAEIARAVLAGELGARRDVVVLNAAAALRVAGAAATLEEGVGLAAESLDSGAAAARLSALVAATRAAACRGHT
jgi:anthranilate phosphoribosyltransferase